MFFTNNLSGIDHCFFSRLGGVSHGIYKSLNCGKGSGDNIPAIEKNLSIASKYYSLKKSNIIIMYQTHSNKAVVVNNSNKYELFNCDGVVTKENNLILSVLTADCAPLLFYEEKNKIIGACHAGWKGALNGIIKNTISQIIELGGKRNNIHCSIGPCIHQKSYEVSPPFYKNFINEDLNNESFFKKKSHSKYMFSLTDFILKKLSDEGVSKNEVVSVDTFSDEILCFSYRRNFKKNLIDYGRMISTIVIKDS